MYDGEASERRATVKNDEDSRRERFRVPFNVRFMYTLLATAHTAHTANTSGTDLEKEVEK